MTNFTGAHEQQLRDYFGGFYAGLMGLTSWAGPMLDHAQSAALHPVDRSMDYMPVAPTSHEAQRAAHEISEGALQAARALGRIEQVLLGCVPHLAVLRAAYAPRGPAALNPEIVLVVGEDEARRIYADGTSEDRDVRRAAKKALDSAVHRAKVARERAQAAYAESDATVGGAMRDARLARFERILEGACA